MNLGDIQKEVHGVATDHGWWEAQEVPAFFYIPEKIALIHSELSEALEEYRTEGEPTAHFAEEMADVVIRVMDLCEHLGISLEDAILAKTEKNKLRPYRHGKVC